MWLCGAQLTSAPLIICQECQPFWVSTRQPRSEALSPLPSFVFLKTTIGGREERAWERGWLATREGKMGRSLPPFRDFPLTFMAQACPVKMAEFWPSTACLWAETQTKSINTQKITRPIYSLLVPSDPYQKLSAYSARKFILFSRNCERVSFASCSLNYQGFI